MSTARVTVMRDVAPVVTSTLRAAGVGEIHEINLRGDAAGLDAEGGAVMLFNGCHRASI